MRFVTSYKATIYDGDGKVFARFDVAAADYSNAAYLAAKWARENGGAYAASTIRKAIKDGLPHSVLIRD